MKKVCPVCGKEFETGTGRGSSARKMCSKECAKKRKLTPVGVERKRIEPSRLFDCVCERCGNPFRAKSPNRALCKRCAEEDKEKQRGRKKVCMNCIYGQEFKFYGIVCNFCEYTGSPRGITIEECIKRGEKSRYTKKEGRGG